MLPLTDSLPPPPVCATKIGWILFLPSFLLLTTCCPTTEGWVLLLLLLRELLIGMGSEDEDEDEEEEEGEDTPEIKVEVEVVLDVVVRCLSSVPASSLHFNIFFL